MRGEDILNVLLDVEWVVGSFVANAVGQLLFYQMPPEFGEQELQRTTARLASIVRCAELCQLGVEQCAFNLNRYQLSMTSFRGGFLCVMVEAPVNRRALEMATRIAAEALPGLVDSLAADSASNAHSECGQDPLDEATSGKHASPELEMPRSAEAAAGDAMHATGRLHHQAQEAAPSALARPSTPNGANSALDAEGHDAM